MTTKKLKEAMYRFIEDRNYEGRYTTLDNIHRLSMRLGYTLQDSGYAIQKLKKEKRLMFVKRYGWVVK